MGEARLSDLHQQYVDGGLSKKELEGKIFQWLLQKNEHYNIFPGNQDRWEEYLSWLYPRLSRAVDLYRDLGSSFEAYIGGVVNCTSREYRCREADHYLTEYVCWRAKAEEMMALESECDYPEEQKNITFPVSDDLNPRQLLFLLLKSYYYATDELIKQVSEKIGMDTGAVKDLIKEIKRRRFGKELEFMDLSERLQCQHYRCLAYEKRMYSAQPGTEYHEKMKERFDRARTRFRKMRIRLGNIRLTASNRIIAEVMGIPKGTVDSGLSAIKNQILTSCKAG